uniref:Uncharacterized protein n=1 Tax=Ascaris lumbricoides TaxID=6252 RepID=A0A0M3I2R4_ASCLU
MGYLGYAGRSQGRVEGADGLRARPFSLRLSSFDELSLMYAWKQIFEEWAVTTQLLPSVRSKLDIEVVTSSIEINEGISIAEGKEGYEGADGTQTIRNDMSVGRWKGRRGADFGHRLLWSFALGTFLVRAAMERLLHTILGRGRSRTCFKYPTRAPSHFSMELGMKARRNDFWRRNDRVHKIALQETSQVAWKDSFVIVFSRFVP